MLNILLNAGISPILVITYVLLLIFLIVYVKIVIARGQSARVRSLSTFEAFQRLHAGGLDLDPSYITGFSDGEGSFFISILKNNNYRVGYVVSPVFSIQLHIKDYDLLMQIKNYFQAGTLQIKNNKIGDRSVIYSIKSLKEITEKVIPHFDNFPLLTKKKADYLLFKEVIILMSKGKHLTVEGLRDIMAYKASINKGLNESLKKEFDVTPVQRPEVSVDISLINLNWLFGFIEAEATFLCLVRKNPDHLIGFAVTLSFSLPQHSKDKNLMLKIQEFLGWGKIYERDSMVDLRITRRSEINSFIDMIKGQLKGVKNLDLNDFIKIQDIVNNDLHKTKEGLAKIRKIKENMNMKRNVEK